MAASKEAVIIDASAASRAALAAAVAELTETIASLPATTIKRRLRDAEIVLPSAFACTNGFAAAADGFSSPYAKIEAAFEPKATEGLEEK